MDASRTIAICRDVGESSRSCFDLPRSGALAVLAGSREPNSFVNPGAFSVSFVSSPGFSRKNSHDLLTGRALVSRSATWAAMQRLTNLDERERTETSREKAFGRFNCFAGPTKSDSARSSRWSSAVQVASLWHHRRVSCSRQIDLISCKTRRACRYEFERD